MEALDRSIQFGAWLNVFESLGVKWTLSRWFNFRPRPKLFPRRSLFSRAKTVKTILFGIFVINHVSKCFPSTCNGIMDGKEEGKVFNIIFTLFERIWNDWKAFGVCGETIATCELYPTIELSRWEAILVALEIDSDILSFEVGRVDSRAFLVLIVPKLFKSFLEKMKHIFQKLKCCVLKAWKLLKSFQILFPNITLKFSLNETG